MRDQDQRIQNLSKSSFTVSWHFIAPLWLSVRDIFCGEDYKSIQVKGKTVFLADIPTTYSAIMDKARSLFEWLTRGIETKLHFPPSSLVDDLDASTPSYSFLDTLILEEYHFRSITHLLEDRKYAIKIDENGEVQWSKVAITDWVKKAQELNECLLFLLHLGSGQPARGTES